MIIDESTHKQLINANKVLVDIINDLTDRHPIRLTHAQSFAVAKTIELRQMAIIQARQAGITFEEWVK